MTVTPGTPDDWTDTVEPERVEAFVERLPADLGYNLRHYADIAHRAGETCHCRPSRIPHFAFAAPESARPASVTPEQPAEAPGQGEDSPSPSEPVFNSVSYPWGDIPIVCVLTEDKPADTEGGGALPDLPRQIELEDVRVGMVVELRKGETYAGGRVTRVDGSRIETEVAWFIADVSGDRGWSLWLIEDAPAPVDPDAAAVEALVTAYRRSPECSTDAVFGEAVLDYLRARGFDVTPRAEQ